MARTTPVNTGYTIINGTGTGSNGDRIHVWAEYLVGQADVAGNRTWLTVYFYAALNPSYSSTTSYYSGLNSTFTVNGVAAGGVSDGAYDFSSASNIHTLGSFSGWVGHSADGTKNVSLSGSFTTKSSYISGGNVSGTITLPTIGRASAVSASNVSLGSACRVSWTPASAQFQFQLTFSLGSWSKTVSAIKPGISKLYTYTGFTLPLEAARQFSGTTGQMKVTLTTYSGSTAVGTSQTTFTVTLPNNANTRPTVTAQLSPVCQAFPGYYVEKLSKVSASVTATDPLGASITGYTISTGGTAIAGTVSGYLDKAGAVTVTITAKNSRGFVGTWQKTVQVSAYAGPRILTANAQRCLDDGTADPCGTYLRIAATWQHSSVENQNTCTLRWRYRSIGGSWSSWRTLSGTSGVDTGAISGIYLDKTKAYTVMLELVDTAGGTGQAIFAIPVEQVYMHRKKDGMGLGGYADGTDLLDVHWDVRTRQSVNGIYMQKTMLYATDTLSLQTMFSVMDGIGNSRQTILLFGNDNGLLIHGVLLVNDAGVVKWSGTSGVSASADKATGMLTVTLPGLAYDRFVLLSTDKITVV